VDPEVKVDNRASVATAQYLKQFDERMHISLPSIFPPMFGK
jgi:hypothetical protein